MECSKYESQFNDYLDGELSGKERQTLQTHLRKCLSCYRKWNSLQKTAEILSRLPKLNPPSHLSAVVMARLKERRLPRITAPFAYIPKWLSLGAAAALLLMVSLTLWQVLLPSYSLRSFLSGQDNNLRMSGTSDQPRSKFSTTREGDQPPVPVMVLRVKDFSRADRELQSMLHSIAIPMVQVRERFRPLDSGSARLIDVRVPGQRFSHLLRELHKIGHLDQSQVEIHRLTNPQNQKAISIRILVVGGVDDGSDAEVHQRGE
jgi:hypothetical protein